MSTNMSPFHSKLPLTSRRRYCTSPLFTITSSDGDKYHIHSALLIKHSPVFKQLIEGPWKESGAGGVEWTEYSSTTVSIFAEWLYTGKYGCVYPEYVCRLPFGVRKDLLSSHGVGDGLRFDSATVPT